MSELPAEPGASPIIIESHYPASRERVYNAWTDPDRVKQWFGSQPGALHEATIDLRPGGRWRFTEHADSRGSVGFEGEYLEIVPNELLVFTWAKITTHSSGPADSTPCSKVEIRFVDAGTGTTMRIVHANLDPESRSGFRAGWAMGLSNLAAYLQP